MSNSLKTWTSITAFLSIFVYIDVFYLFTIFFITVPLAIFSAIISIIIAFKEKQTKYIYLNLLFAVIAVIAFIIIPW